MLEIESFWKGMKPFAKVEKGKGGIIGYGFRKKGKDRPGRCQKRKAYREIRKYGFDLSETWGLDSVFQRWLSDEFSGFFRICGDADDWGTCDLEGTYYDFWEHRNEESYIQKMTEWEETRYKSFEAHLRDLLENATDEQMKKFADFCSPRLRKLADVTHGWPAGDTFPEFEDWRKAIYDMADKFDNGTYSEFFITYFFHLWD